MAARPHLFLALFLLEKDRPSCARSSASQPTGNNGDAHLKAGLVGPSETVPLIEGKLGLSTWRNLFFCEFDGPRPERSVVVTVIADGRSG